MTGSIEAFLTDWADAEERGDTGRLESLLTDDFLGVGPIGFVLTKAAWLARFAGGLSYETFGLEEIQSRRHGQTAIVTARQIGRGTIRGWRFPTRRSGPRSS